MEEGGSRCAGLQLGDIYLTVCVFLLQNEPEFSLLVPVAIVFFLPMGVRRVRHTPNVLALTYWQAEEVPLF